MAEWNHVLNDRDPEHVGCNSEYAAHWTCYYCGKSWISMVRNKHVVGCNECISKIASKRLMMPKRGESLKDRYPEIADEWHSCDVVSGPEYVKPGSNCIVTWKCLANQNHGTWTASVYSRAILGTGCPECANVLRSLTHSTPKLGDSLEIKYPEVSKYWDREKNGCKASEVYAHSDKVYGWRCPICGSEWENKVREQVKRVHQCHDCVGTNRVSFPEKALYFYVSSVFPDAEANYRPADGSLNRFELDIFIPSIMTAFEYDGEYWHNLNKEKDARKDEVCSMSGIRLIRIRESNCAEYDSAHTTVITRDLSRGYDGLDAAIVAAMSEVGVKGVDVDTRRDSPKILELMKLASMESSIAHTHPNLVNEWCSEYNIGIRPAMFTHGSKALVYWKCKNGHIYQSTICARTAGYGCDTCSRIENGRKLATPKDGDLTLGEARPDLVDEWCKELNGDLTPYDVYPTSNKEVWWKCLDPNCGHVWLAQISNRTSGKKSGCRKCRYRRMAELQKIPPKGKSLADTNKLLAEFWVAEKNGGLSAAQVFEKTRRKSVWTCPKCKEEWTASGDLMSRRKTKCKVCGYGKVIPK